MLTEISVKAKENTNAPIPSNYLNPILVKIIILNKISSLQII